MNRVLTALLVSGMYGGSEFWVVVLVTYVIALYGFSHVVAGSIEAWLLLPTGEVGIAHSVGGFILPGPLGNIIGGTGLFAGVAHGQVRDEIATEGWNRVAFRRPRHLHACSSPRISPILHLGQDNVHRSKISSG